MFDTSNLQTITKIFLSFLGIKIIIQNYLDLRNIRSINRHKKNVPAPFSSVISKEEYEKNIEYNLTNISFGKKARTFNLLVLLAWTILGGLDLLTNLTLHTFDTNWKNSLLLVFSFSIINQLLSLPFDIYKTFVIEEKFGFNKTTKKVFVLDIFKGLLLSALIMGPIFLLILFFLNKFPSNWWVWSFIATASFQIILIYAYPTLIAPLFNKFTPLEEEEIKEKVDCLLEKSGFEAKGLFVMDASKRSGHGNAYFTGLGKQKRIVFFDTLLEQLRPDELVSVLAHEIGHSKKNHIIKGIVLSLLMSFLAFYLTHIAINHPNFLSSHGLNHHSLASKLILVSLIFSTYSFFLTPIFNFLSRKNEFEADHYAAKMTNPDDLISGLLNLYKHNLGNLTPDDLYSSFYHSHPPASVRIKHLEGLK
ncbi:MAG: peptidase M48 [Halobacteriovoraceae bacterium]|nr:peptidase M48 [Halobacteriovoraceae bacterium]